jgi:hypothetical protein
MKLSEVFSSELPGHIIEGFPYPEKVCRHCDKKMDLYKVIHIIDAEEEFKAVYLCTNDKCPAYDFPAKKAHVVMYFSSDNAFDKLQGLKIWVDKKHRPTRND